MCFQMLHCRIAQMRQRLFQAQFIIGTFTACSTRGSSLDSSQAVSITARHDAGSKLDRRSLIVRADEKGQWPDSVKKAMDNGREAMEGAADNAKDAIGGLEAKAAEAADTVRDAVPDDAPAGFDKVKARRKASNLEVCNSSTSCCSLRSDVETGLYGAYWVGKNGMGQSG
jgi:hypothetical protein